MKKILYSLFLATLALSGTSYGTVTLSTFFGIATDSVGTAVPDGTLWVMIVNNGDSVLPGGLEINSSLTAGQDETAISSAFQTSIAIGDTIGGDTVFAMGGMNGNAIYSTSGLNTEVLELDLGVDGLVAGEEFGFYWFPGITYTAGTTDLSGITEVGGISDITGVDSAVGSDPMIIPSDGGTSAPGATTSDVGGSFSTARFTAVSVPETSSALLSLMGAAALLRRRRA